MPGSIRPFEGNVFETRVLLCLLHVFLQRRHVAPERAIYAVGGNQDAAPQAEVLTQSPLPEENGVWIMKRGEPVVKNDLLQFHPAILSVRKFAPKASTSVIATIGLHGLSSWAR